MTRKRKWTLRVVGVAVLAAVGIGTWAGLHGPLRAKYAAHKLATATTDEERAMWADALAGYGEPGIQKLVACVKSGDDHTRSAAIAAIDRHLSAMPEGDPRAITIAGVFLDAFPTAGEPGQRAILGLVPTILKRTGTTHAQRCREIVAAGLKMSAPDARLAAARLALHPDLRLRAELRPLLAANEPEVRGAALFGFASLTDGEV